MHYQSAIAVLMIVPFISRAALQPPRLHSRSLLRIAPIRKICAVESLVAYRLSLTVSSLIPWYSSKQRYMHSKPYLGIWGPISSEHQSSLSSTVPLQASSLHPNTHHKHAFHTRPQRCCRRRPCRGSDHRSEQLPLPHRSGQRLFVQ